jgi:hypothetical protein
MPKKTEEVAEERVKEGTIDPPYSIRLPPAIRDDLKKIAKRECRSLAKQIVYALQMHVEDEKQKFPNE